MEKELYTLKDPSMGLEINGVRLGANQLTKKKVIELVNRQSAYAKYFNMPVAEKPKKKSKNESKNKDKS